MNREMKSKRRASRTRASLHDDDLSVSSSISNKSQVGPPDFVLTRMMFTLQGYQRKLRMLSQVRLFSRWKSVIGSLKLQTISTDSTTSAQDKYLKLFSDNEKLREQYLELKRSSSLKESNMRKGGIAFITMFFIRSKLKSRMKGWFDRWKFATKTENQYITLHQQKLKLEVGMKHVESKQRSMKKVEQENERLKKMLFFTHAFLKWKIRTALAKLAQEKYENEYQRNIIMKEILSLKKMVKYNTHNEITLLKLAKDRGKKLEGNLSTIRETFQSLKRSFEKDSEDNS